MVTEDIRGNSKEVSTRARAQATAHALDRRRDLLGLARWRPFGEQLSNDVRQSLFARGIVRCAGPETQADRQRRLLVILDEQQRHPIRQSDIVERRKLHGPHPGGRGWTGGEGLLGGK